MTLINKFYSLFAILVFGTDRANWPFRVQMHGKPVPFGFWLSDEKRYSTARPLGTRLMFGDAQLAVAVLFRSYDDGPTLLLGLPWFFRRYDGVLTIGANLWRSPRMPYPLRSMGNLRFWLWRMRQVDWVERLLPSKLPLAQQKRKAWADASHIGDEIAYYDNDLSLVEMDRLAHTIAEDVFENRMRAYHGNA